MKNKSNVLLLKSTLGRPWGPGWEVNQELDSGLRLFNFIYVFLILFVVSDTLQTNKINSLLVLQFNNNLPLKRDGYCTNFFAINNENK